MVADEDVLGDGQIGGAVGENARAAVFHGGQAGDEQELVRAAHVGVADDESADGGLVGHGDGRAHAHAVDDGGDAAAEGSAIDAGDQETAAPKGDARSQHHVFFICARGVVDIDVPQAKGMVHGQLNGRKGVVAAAVAGGIGVAIHEIHVGHEREPLPLAGSGAGGIHGGELRILDELRRFQPDLGIAHDHLGEAGAEIAGFAGDAGLRRGKRIAAAGNLGEIKRNAQPGAGEPVAAGQILVLIGAGIEEEGGEQAHFGAGLPALRVVAEIAVEIIGAGEHARFHRLGFDGEGKAQADFPVVAAERLLVLFESPRGSGGGEDAGEGVVLDDGVIVGMGIAPTFGGPRGLARGGFGPAADEGAVVLGIVVIGARIDPRAEQFEADAPLVVIRVARVAVVVIGIRAKNDLLLGQQLAIADAEVVFLRVMVGEGGAGIHEQQAGAARIPQRNQQIADTFGFRVASLKTNRQFGGRPIGGRFGFHGGGRRRRLFVFRLGLGLGRLHAPKRTEHEHHQRQRQRADPASLHCNLHLAESNEPMMRGHPMPCPWRVALTFKIWYFLLSDATRNCAPRT